MSLFDFFRSKRSAQSSSKRRRKTETGIGILQYLDVSPSVALGVFLLTVVAIFIISFVGVSPAMLHVLRNQKATVRIVSDADFSYTSELLRERKRARIQREVPRVYKIDLTELDQFEAQIHQLELDLYRLDARWPAMTEADKVREVSSIADAINQRDGFQVSPRDLVTLMNYGDTVSRKKLIDDGLYVLREICRGGIFEPENADASSSDRDLLMFQIERPDTTGEDQVKQRRVLTVDEAATNLRINITAENTAAPVMTALVRLLRPAIRNNVVPDDAATADWEAKIVSKLKPVTVKVEAGETIIEPGTIVTEEQEEKLLEYQKFINRTHRLPSGIDVEMFGPILLVIGMIIVAGFYLRLEDPMTLKSNARLGLLALVLVFSLGLVRLTLEAGNTSYFAATPRAAALLPYVAPTAFAPMVIAVLIGAGPALYCGLLVSVFSAIMFGNRLDILVLSLLSTSVVAFACRSIRRRSRIVRSGILSGLTLAAFVFLLSLADRMPTELLWQAPLGAVITGMLTGIVVVGLLPLLESLFRRTTDITLLELTDYNHPLLRRMQMDAPGTYHHSLMVANLSENAANAIGANALLCRVCCMFHDIGKLIKPDYFAENQRGGVNPHMDRSPSFSALIIKSHVKEGIDLAVKHKLPRPVLDVIRQHHGTTLIRYFYEQARERAKSAQSTTSDGHLLDPNAATEATFRYDGPRPQFKESAIILCADSVEAASRSLQKVTPQAIEELIDAIIREKIEDGQIDESPLTIQEIALIRRSFTFTLLNSLHSRVVYPKAEKTRGTHEPDPHLGSKPAKAATAAGTHP